MIRPRMFVVLGTTILAAMFALVACSDDERDVALEMSNEAGASDTSNEIADGDAGIVDVSVGSPRPDYDASDEPVVCTSTPCVTQLIAGANYFCGLLVDGTVRCWGEDFRGSLGRGGPNAGTNTGSPPKPVVSLANVAQISASSLGNTTCARSIGGRVQCWGDNANAQLGLRVSPALRDTAAHHVPTDVALTAEVVRVDVGPTSVCAIDTDGKVYCWGYNGREQLARPDAGTSDASAYQGPGVADTGGYEIVRIAGGYESVFGLTSDHQLVGWGRVSGRDSSQFETAVPFLIPSLVDADVTYACIGGVDGTVAGSTACAVRAGSVYCWGDNSVGAIGTAVRDWVQLPLRVEVSMDGKAFPQQLALAQTTSCMRMTDGTLQCSGRNQLGQLGRGVTSPSAAFFARATVFDGRAVQVAVSTSATCALVQGGEVMCWGGNAYGELGQGTKDSDAHLLPTKVVFQ